MNSASHQGIGMTSMRTRERLIKQLQDMGISNKLVLETIRNTPRHIFVDEALASRAYDNTALPIGFGQTISQPYTVARMTEILLETGPVGKVLEVGTGSGYQTAVLAGLVGEVYSVERISALLNRARQRMRDLRNYNVRLKHYDGHMGWAAYAPYDAIIVTAAPSELPEELLAQLNIGGRLIIPVGPSGKQRLTLFVHTPQGFEQRDIEDASFVPLLPGNC